MVDFIPKGKVQREGAKGKCKGSCRKRFKGKVKRKNQEKELRR